MTKEELLTFVLLGFVVLVGLMAVGWYTRKRRQRALPSLTPVSADPGAIIAEFSGFYVSTTPEGQPLNRIAARGLGFRARARLIVTEGGVIVSLPSQDFWIAAANIREITTAQYTIDRVVEEGGLVLLAWTLGTEPEQVELDSYFRFTATAEVIDAISAVVSKWHSPYTFTPDESEEP